MLHHPGRNTCWLSALVLTLSACGGGSDSQAPAASSLTADSADVAWNAPADVDVLANDTAGGGALSLSAVSAPAHGSAAIVNGKVHYTPAAGYFGPDELTYTATRSDASSATAKLSFSVNAVLTLSGTVADGPIADAAVTVLVGSKSVATTADANGAYSVTIRSADPAAMVVLTASGAGARSNVKLSSAVGDVAALAAQAATDGTLAASQLAALNVSNLSSSVLALVTEVHGGQPPATRAQFEALVTRVSLQRATDMAAAIKLVVDHGVALPQDVADTLALVDHPSSSPVLDRFLLDQSRGDAPTPLDTARLEVLASNTPAGDARVAVNAPQTLIYFVGDKLHGIAGIDVTYRPDGTARVVTIEGARDAIWTIAAGQLNVVLASPYSQESYTAEVDPVTNMQTLIRLDTTGYRFRQAIGSADNGAVLLITVGGTTMLEGPQTGTFVPYDTSTGTLLKAADATAAPPATLAFTASDFPAGAMWAGVVPRLNVPMGSNFLAPQDLLAIVDGSSATYVHLGAPVAWSIVDGSLRLVDGTNETRYRRLTAATVTGEEHWLVSSYVNGAVVSVQEQLAVKATPGLRFAADASVSRRWISGIDDAFAITVYANGTSDASGAAAGSVVVPGWTWLIDGNGNLVQTRTTSFTRRTWQLLRNDAGAILVMERVGLPPADNTRGWRVNIYTDGGPATL